MSGIQTERVQLKCGDATTMGAFLARPKGEGKRPGVVVFPEAFGVNSSIRGVCERLAREGFSALAPELFHRTAPAGAEFKYDFASVKEHFDAVTLETLNHDAGASYDFLAAHPSVRRDALSCVGFCLGGRAAYLANAIRPFASAVSFYGAGIAPRLLGRAADQHGPILLFWGGLDAHIPPAQVASIADALRKTGKPFVNVDFSAADHAFFNEERPSHHPDAARQAWALTLAFLKR